MKSGGRNAGFRPPVGCSPLLLFAVAVLATPAGPTHVSVSGKLRGQVAVVAHREPPFGDSRALVLLHCRPPVNGAPTIPRVPMRGIGPLPGALMKRSSHHGSSAEARAGIEPVLALRATGYEPVEQPLLHPRSLPEQNRTAASPVRSRGAVPSAGRLVPLERVERSPPRFVVSAPGPLVEAESGRRALCAPTV